MTDEKIKFAKKDIFVTDFWEFDIPHHEKLKKIILSCVENDEDIKDLINFDKQFSVSNHSYGGFEYRFGEKQIGKQNITSLNKLLFTLLNYIDKEHDWEKGVWSDLVYWLNINSKNEFNPPHMHPGCHYSGVYYVKVPKQTSCIHFLDPRPNQLNSRPDIKNVGKNPFWSENKYDSSVYTFEPKEGKVIIFPSSLVHYVDPNPSDEIRVSLAFNSTYNNNQLYR